MAKSSVTPNRLKYHRIQRHWTQAELAAQLDLLCTDQERAKQRGLISTFMIYGWENGKHSPNPFWRKKLCDLFQASPSDLGFLEEVSLIPPGDEKNDEKTLNQELLSSYLQQQCTRLCEALASGSTTLRIDDIVGGAGLFIAPPWNWKEVTDEEQMIPLLEYLVERIHHRKRILLLGEAGQGKTTILKIVFTKLVEHYLGSSDEKTPFPLYIPLRDLDMLTGNPVDILWASVGEDFPFSYEAFVDLLRQKRLIFLYDGFDEISGEITQQRVNERARSKIFSLPCLLSCRKSFFEAWLSMSPLLEMNDHIELQPLTMDAVEQYIGAFCRHKQQKSTHRIPSPEKVIRLLQKRQELQALAQRPLLVMMILELFTSAQYVEEEGWSIAKLYRSYTEKWLKHEANHQGSVLRWNEKMTLLEYVAWYTYASPSPDSSPGKQVTFTFEDLASCVHLLVGYYPGKTEADLLDDLCLRTFLNTEGIAYSFLHKSFQDYFVARYIFGRLGRREPQSLEIIEQVFQTSLPYDVAVFLKEMLGSHDLTTPEIQVVTMNLIAVYQRNVGRDQRVHIREQASHYLTCVGTEEAIAFLENVCEEETDKWVRRGIVVGLALYSGKTVLLEHYIRTLRSDSESAALNLGYHLCYYGDRASTRDVAAPIQEREKCDKTVAAVVRHLHDERYRYGWVLDLLTLSSLLEVQGKALLEKHADHVLFLTQFLQREHQDLGDLFREERDRLKKIMI